jgi:hypothetical protein
MKKIMMLFMAALLLFSLSGQAMAYFEDGNLIRVIYDLGGTKEIVTDLGAGWNLTAPSTSHELFNTNNFSLTDLGISDWSNVYVAYFSLTNVGGDQNAWTSGPQTGQSNTARSWTNFSTYAHTVTGANSLTGNAQNIVNQTDPSSFVNNMGTAGRFSSFLPEPGNGYQNLAALNAPGNGYVDQWLYYYGNPTSAGTGVQLFKIRTNEDGTTDINPVPIPATVYLFGSGLLGLIGIRRRMTA